MARMESMDLTQCNLASDPGNRYFCSNAAELKAAVMGELLGSGRATEKLLQMYTPFVAFAVLATLRGLFSPRRRSASGTSASHAPSSRKKRA